MSILINTASTIITEVATRINVLSADEADNIMTDINQCTKDVQLSFPQAPFLQTSTTKTLSAGVSEYPAESDFEKMYSVRYPNGDIKLTFLPTEQFDAFLPNLNTSGSPSIYTLTNGGTTVKYAPVPGSALDVELRYHKLLNTISAQSATPPLPTKYVELYNLYGEFRGLRRQQRYSDASVIKNEYEQMKQQMIEDLKDMTSESVPIRSIREFGGGIRQYGNPIKNIYGNSNLP